MDGKCKEYKKYYDAIFKVDTANNIVLVVSFVEWNSKKFFFIFSEPAKPVLFDKNCIFDLFTQNYRLPKYFSPIFIYIFIY